MAAKTFTAALTAEQAAKLRAVMVEDGFDFSEKPYTLFYGQKAKLTVAVYEKGPKVVVQGKQTEEFVQFRLEPEVLGEARLGYEETLNPEMFSAHFGIDESGKGDFFGPMVVAGVYVNPEIAHTLRDAGIMDSKRITSDARIRELAKAIRSIRAAAWDRIVIGPETYNRLIEKMGSVNRLLAWGHAKVIANLMDKQPDCPRSLSDQFGNPKLIVDALKKQGREIELQQRTKAESDPAVAAASILAREGFIDWMDAKGRELGERLPRGASAEVKTTATKLIGLHTPAVLEQIAKTHFRTAAEVAPGHYVMPPPRQAWVKRNY